MSVKIITETRAAGQVVVAVAVEYEEILTPGDISSSSYEVLANRINEKGGELARRTISRVYTNDRPALSGGTLWRTVCRGGLSHTGL